MHVLTLDRVVSLEDYQNFTLAFAGIAKALATWTWFGRTRGVFLSVAGANGAVFQAGDPTLVALVSALQAAGNPYVPIQVVSYQPVLFEIAVGVRIDTTDYDPTLVLATGLAGALDRLCLRATSTGAGGGAERGHRHDPADARRDRCRAERVQPARAGGGRSAQPGLAGGPPLAGQNSTPQGAEMLLLDPGSQGNIGVW